MSDLLNVVSVVRPNNRLALYDCCDVYLGAEEAYWTLHRTEFSIHLALKSIRILVLAYTIEQKLDFGRVGVLEYVSHPRGEYVGSALNRTISEACDYTKKDVRTKNVIQRTTTGRRCGFAYPSPDKRLRKGQGES